jgi:hypothetical protein
MRTEECIEDLVGKLSEKGPPENIGLDTKDNIKIMFKKIKILGR